MAEQSHDPLDDFPTKKDLVKDNLLVDMGNLKDYCNKVIAQAEQIEQIVEEGYIPKPELSCLIGNIFQLEKRLIRIEHGCDLYQKHMERQS